MRQQQTSEHGLPLYSILCSLLFTLLCNIDHGNDDAVAWSAVFSVASAAESADRRHLRKIHTMTMHFLSLSSLSHLLSAICVSAVYCLCSRCAPLDDDCVSAGDVDDDGRSHCCC